MREGDLGDEDAPTSKLELEVFFLELELFILDFESIASTTGLWCDPLPLSNESIGVCNDVSLGFDE